MIESIKNSGLLWAFILAMTILPVIAVFSVNIYGSAPYLLALLCIACIMLRHDKFPNLDRPLLAFIGTLAVTLLASSMWALDPLYTLGKAARQGALMFACFACWCAVTALKNDERARINYLFTLSFPLALLLITLELTFDHPLYRILSGKMFDAHVIPSVVNHGCVILSLVYWPFLKIMRDSKRTYWALACGAALLGVVALLGKSETALVSLALGAASFVIARFFPLGWVYAFGATAVVGILAAPWFAQGAFALLAEPLSVWKSAHAGERLDIWNTVATYALQKPVYGYGMEACRFISDFTYNGFYTKRTYIQHPHNNILQIWIELGLIGAVLATTLFALVTSRMRKMPPTAIPYAAACLTGCTAVALVGYGLWQAWWTGVIFLTAITLKISYNSER